MNTIAKAERTVKVATAAATATGAIPVPFADAPLLIGEQVAMMATIAGFFKLSIKEDGLKALAATALGVGGATVVGKTVVSNILKFIPGVGWLVGGAISGAAAGVITYSIGMAFIEVCKSIQIGKMDEEELTSKEGITAFTGFFKGFFKKGKKNKHAPYLYGEDKDWDEDDEDEQT